MPFQSWRKLWWTALWYTGKQLHDYVACMVLIPIVISLILQMIVVNTAAFSVEFTLIALADSMWVLAFSCKKSEIDYQQHKISGPD